MSRLTIRRAMELDPFNVLVMEVEHGIWKFEPVLDSDLRDDDPNGDVFYPICDECDRDVKRDGVKQLVEIRGRWEDGDIQHKRCWAKRLASEARYGSVFVSVNSI